MEEGRGGEGRRGEVGGERRGERGKGNIEGVSKAKEVKFFVDQHKKTIPRIWIISTRFL